MFGIKPKIGTPPWVPCDPIDGEIPYPGKITPCDPIDGEIPYPG